MGALGEVACGVPGNGHHTLFIDKRMLRGKNEHASKLRKWTPSGVPQTERKHSHEGCGTKVMKVHRFKPGDLPSCGGIVAQPNCPNGSPDPMDD